MKKTDLKKHVYKSNFALFTAIVFFAVFGFVNTALGQTTIYTTDFGTVPNVNPVGWTFAGLGMNTSTNTPSTGYPGASGNVYLGEGNSNPFTNTTGNAQATSPLGTSEAVLLVSTTGYSNVALSFGMRKASAAYNTNATYTLAWSTDNITYTTINYTEATAGAWGLVSGAGLTLPAGATNQANLYIRWKFDRTGAGSNFKIDDVSLIGNIPPLIPATISFLSNDTTAMENAGSANVYLKLTSVSTASSAISVSVSLLSNASVTDYTLANTTVTFAANAPINSTAAISINLNDDALLESAEYVILRLSNPQNATAGTISQFAFYIGDNDKLAPVPSNALNLNLLSSFSNSITGSNSAEIVVHDPTTQRLYIANSIGAKLDIINFINPSNPTLLFSIPISTYGNINSVAVRNGVVAAAIENGTNPQDSGKVVFFDQDGNFLKQVKVGMMPDMITFNHAGTKVLTANEGEPNAAYTQDPDGSVSIVDISGGIAALTQTNVAHVTFTVYNGQEAALRTQGIRIAGLNSITSKDFEPEYVSVSKDDSKAWVTLQENNAIVEIDLSNNNINYIKSLGTKDHSLLNNGMDVSNTTKGVNIANFTIKGMYMPDAIASYTVGGINYLITANEGDSREYTGFTDVQRISAVNLDAAKFPYAAEMKNNSVLGRLNVTDKMGDIDNDGDLDTLYSYGSRSFSIWNATNGQLVYDSKDDFEMITSTNSFSVMFNASNSNNTKKDRSDDKGPEPEGVTIGTIGANTYAFIAVERIGGVMVYDVTNPNAPVFVTYVNNRSLPSGGPDRGSEGIIFIPQSQSPNGQHIVIAANEVSSTLSIWGIAGCTTPVSTSLSVSNTTACVNTPPSVSVPSVAGLSYQWSNNGSAVTGATLNVITPTVSGSYSVAITGVANCSASSLSQSISILATPTLVVAGSTTVCPGSALSQTVSGASTYSWSSGPTTSVVSLTPAGTTVYTITGTAANTCSSSVTQTITTNATPTLVVAGSNSVCSGSALSQTVSGASTYSLNSSSTPSVISLTPAGTTVYTITGTAANTCTGSVTQTITVNALPTVAVSGNTVVCLTQTTTLTASGASTSSWNTGAATNTLSVLTTTTATYTVTGTSTANCSSSATTTVIVNPLPVLAINGGTQACVGTPLSQTVTGATTYAWFGPSVVGTGSVVSLLPSANATYTINGTLNGCSSAITRSIATSLAPNLSISGATVACTGVPLTQTVSGAATYSWSSGETTPAITVANPSGNITYTVTGVSVVGCVGTFVNTVSVSALPVLNVSSSAPEICVGQTATLSVSGADTYSWSNGSNTNMAVVNPTETMVYVVTGTNTANCMASSQITQSVSTCTSLKENVNAFADFSLYPNPTNTSVQIDLSIGSENNISIINAMGQEVLTITNYQANTAINVSDLKKGIYFVRVSSGNNQSIKKLIID